MVDDHVVGRLPIWYHFKFLRWVFWGTTGSVNFALLWQQRISGLLGKTSPHQPRAKAKSDKFPFLWESFPLPPTKFTLCSASNIVD